MSSNLPTPTSNLIDYDLIRDLSLKMTDLQCQKFHFAGNKFRILGKVSTTVQCIKEGSLSGVNFHIKALVVSDLNKIMDTREYQDSEFFPDQLQNIIGRCIGPQSFQM